MARRDKFIEGGPRPGDPVSDGPRPAVAWRDLVWASLMVVVVLLSVLILTAVVLYYAGSGEVQLGGLGTFIGFVVTAAALTNVFWLAAGAWRRTVWGCPFAHTEDAPWGMKCQRHGLVEVSTAPSDPRVEDPPVRP